MKNRKIVISAIVMGCTLLFGSKFSASAANNSLESSNSSTFNYSEFCNEKKSTRYVTEYKVGLNTYQVYEYKNTREFDETKDAYLGLVVNHIKDVDVKITVSDTEYYSDSLSVGGGYTVKATTGAKIFGCGIDVSYEEDVEIESSWASTYTITDSYSWTLDSSCAEGLWYYYDLGYTADYLVAVYRCGSFQTAKKLNDLDGIVPFTSFLQKTPKLLTPLAYKC